jgi:hypothetical protein
MPEGFSRDKNFLGFRKKSDMIRSVVNSHLPLWQGYYEFAHQKTER